MGDQRINADHPVGYVLECLADPPGPVHFDPMHQGQSPNVKTIVVPAVNEQRGRLQHPAVQAQNSTVLQYVAADANTTGTLSPSFTFGAPVTI